MKKIIIPMMLILLVSFVFAQNPFDAEGSGEETGSIVDVSDAVVVQENPFEERVNILMILIIIVIVAIIGIVIWLLYLKKSQSKGQNLTLKNYVNASLKKGFSKKQIKNALLKEGWSSEEIDRVLK